MALFGTDTEYQYKQINEFDVRKFVLGFNQDKAGDKGTWRFKKYVKNKIITKLILPEGKGINDLTKEEFYSLPEVYI